MDDHLCTVIVPYRDSTLFFGVSMSSGPVPAHNALVRSPISSYSANAEILLCHARAHKVGMRARKLQMHVAVMRSSCKQRGSVKGILH